MLQGFIDNQDCAFRRCTWKCLKTCPFKEAPYCIGDALCSAKEGDMEHGFPFAGANAWRVNEIVSVAELMQSLEDEYVAAVAERTQAAPMLAGD